MMRAQEGRHCGVGTLLIVFCVLSGLFTTESICSEKVLPSVAAVQAKLLKINTYELDVIHTGTLKDTSEVVWRAATHFKYKKPSMVVQKSCRKGLIVNRDNPMNNLILDEYVVFDGNSQIRRTTFDSPLFRSVKEGQNLMDPQSLTVKSDNPELVTTKIGLAPDSEYILTIMKLLRSYSWSQTSTNDDKVVLIGRYRSEDRDHQVPAHVFRKRKWGPAGKVEIVIDTKRSLLLEYRFVKRTAPWGERVGDMIYRTRFQKIRIDQKIDSSVFSFIALPGEKIEHHVNPKQPSVAEVLRARGWADTQKHANKRVQLLKGDDDIDCIELEKYLGIPVCALFTEDATQNASLLVNKQNLSIKDMSKVLSRISATAHATIESCTYAAFTPDIVVLLHSPDRLPCLLSYSVEHGLAFLDSPMGRGYFKIWQKYRSEEDKRLVPKKIDLVDLCSRQFPNVWRAKQIRSLFLKEKVRQIVVYYQSNLLNDSDIDFSQEIRNVIRGSMKVMPVSNTFKPSGSEIIFSALVVMESGTAFDFGFFDNAIIVTGEKGQFMIGGHWGQGSIAPAK